MTTKILKASEEDAPEILRLQYAAYQSEALLYNDFSIQPLTQTLAQLEEEFRIGVVLKAVDGGEIIGSVRAHESQNTAYIGKLIVAPQYRNQGIGKRLLRAIELEFPMRRYELYTGDKSDKNIALYQNLGYKIFKNQVINPQLAIVYMEKIKGG
jgi:ribosomal protein S18 acetylase RimI-like enzyme